MHHKRYELNEVTKELHRTSTFAGVMHRIHKIRCQLCTPFCANKRQAAERSTNNILTSQRKHVEFHELAKECVEIATRLYAPQHYWPYEAMHQYFCCRDRLCTTTTTNGRHKRTYWMLVSILHIIVTQVLHDEMRVPRNRLGSTPAKLLFKRHTVYELYRPGCFEVVPGPDRKCRKTHDLDSMAEFDLYRNLRRVRPPEHSLHGPGSECFIVSN